MFHSKVRSIDTRVAQSLKNSSNIFYDDAQNAETPSGVFCVLGD